MQEKDIGPVCELIARAMNEAEADWARRTFEKHFACQTHGLDDGRQYYTCHAKTDVLAICGLHHYAWGPDDNVWLAWFAVDPDYQRQGIGRRLLAMLEQQARARDYRKLFIETYDHPDFARARAFYEACGFERAGEIAEYLHDSESMLVYLKRL
ncbi:MAG: GNAT family N-acetyltransferase [Gammaproteobacteria bacterium]